MRVLHLARYGLVRGPRRDVLVIVKPETVIDWHRAGFRLYWRWDPVAAGATRRLPLKSGSRFDDWRMKMGTGA
jgi:hypothetical protein